VNITPGLLCWMLALVCFGVATFWRPTNPPAFNLMAAGLALLTLGFLLGGAG
jgi:hypothetical protein